MWPEEAAAVRESGRSLTELRSVGPFTAHFIAEWLRHPPDPPVPPLLRDGFITYAYARSVVDAHPEWRAVARADHQMHTDETDGSSTIEEMAEAAGSIGRGRIAITDHSKTLRITNGMDEARLIAQGEHIAAVNERGSARSSSAASRWTSPRRARAIWTRARSRASISSSARSIRSCACVTTRHS